MIQYYRRYLYYTHRYPMHAITVIQSKLISGSSYIYLTKYTVLAWGTMHCMYNNNILGFNSSLDTTYTHTYTLELL